MSTKYKIKELTTVTDENLEKVINETVSEGWTFDCIQFAVRESSKRPSMAFIIFSSLVEDEEDS